MNWFQNYRLEWMHEMLSIYGFINRSHVVRKFGISEAQVAVDFRAFEKAYPDFMFYNPTTKRFEKVSPPTGIQ